MMHEVEQRFSRRGYIALVYGENRVTCANPISVLFKTNGSSLLVVTVKDGPSFYRLTLHEYDKGAATVGNL